MDLEFRTGLGGPLVYTAAFLSRQEIVHGLERRYPGCEAQVLDEVREPFEPFFWHFLC